MASKNRLQFNKELKLLQNRIKNLELQGFDVQKPKIETPKRITKQAIARVHNLRGAELQKSAVKLVDVDNVPQVVTYKQVKQLERQGKITAPTSGVQDVSVTLKQPSKKVLKPKEKTQPKQKKETLEQVIKKGVNAYKREQRKKEREEAKRRLKEQTKSTIKKPRMEHNRSSLPEESNVAIHNFTDIIVKFDNWAPELIDTSKLTPYVIGIKEQHKNIGYNVIVGAKNQAENDYIVAKRITLNWDGILYAIERVMYGWSSYSEEALQEDLSYIQSIILGNENNKSTTVAKAIDDVYDNA